MSYTEESHLEKKYGLPYGVNRGRIDQVIKNLGAPIVLVSDMKQAEIDVTTINYVVENRGATETTGIATFAYFPKQFGSYITKINCFCYDAQTLKPNEKGEFVLIILIDPEVTKDSKTKEVKEATIQFTFFDYKEYKENKS